MTHLMMIYIYKLLSRRIKLHTVKSNTLHKQLDKKLKLRDIVRDITQHTMHCKLCDN